LFGLGLAVADLNADGRPDFFVGHSNRLFVNSEEGVFREAQELNDVFAWKPLDGEDWPCGACFGDLNRDGNLDLVLAIHGKTARNQVYLNDGFSNGQLKFRNVTAEVGLSEPVPVRCPHVEIQDFDNDGWPDIYFSAAWLDGDRVIPLVYRNQGLKDGSIQFAPPRPISPDMVYYPAGPSADYDGDGRLDLFLINWFQGNHSRLLRNVSPQRNWLDVRVEGTRSNRIGIGSRVSVYAAGFAGDQNALLGFQEIQTGYGYASGQPAVAHFGLGDRETVDVVIDIPGGNKVLRERVQAGQTLVMTELAAATAVEPQSEKKSDKKSSKKKGSLETVAIRFPPLLPAGDSGKGIVSDQSTEFLKPPANLQAGVAIAKEPPRIDFTYFPGQDYPGKPWSNWGDSLWANGKYYASIGDHLAPEGNAFVYEFDPQGKASRFRELINVRKLLDLPAGHYTPGKIHTQLGIGADGWLYCATHRGSTRATTAENHFKGEWILRVDPATARAEVVVQGPVPMHCIPTGLIDPERMIFYGATAAGDFRQQDIHFFAYDLRQRTVLTDVVDGPARAMIWSRSTGRVYYSQGRDGEMMRFDPADGKPPTRIAGSLSIRAASQETATGIVYLVSYPEQGSGATLHAFDTNTEQVTLIGSANVGSQSYITSLDVDASGRYLYYIPGSHGGADQDGSPVVQFDLVQRTRKVVAFLHPFYKDRYGCALVGTYSYALSADGGDLFVTWNANRGGGRAWDTCALTVIHIPPAER
jgi:hypothetical protein